MLKGLLRSYWLTALLAAMPAQVRPQVPAPHVQACRIGPAKPEFAVRCGTVDVFENRGARSGRTIALKVIEVDASGTSDPATPPEFGRSALRYLPNARQIVIPHATHDIESPCTDALLVAFVRARSAKKLDGSVCVASSKRPPFATSLAGFGNERPQDG